MKLQAVTANQEKGARKRKEAIPALPDPLRNFDNLPNAAYVRLPVVLMLFGVSRTTVWRMCKSSSMPAPKKLGRRVAVWNVGELRQVLNAGAISEVRAAP
jgi:predicted DNA-binding transcriptional regulator AlpA